MIPVPICRANVEIFFKFSVGRTVQGQLDSCELAYMQDEGPICERDRLSKLE